tara:strand:- start:14015 stop:14344 length:330 start_codon:yes stop_codon:yes gene_type:complete
MANGTAKQEVIEKFWPGNDAADTMWDALNLDSVPFGLDHMMLGYAMSTSAETATSALASMHDGYDTLEAYFDSSDKFFGSLDAYGEQIADSDLRINLKKEAKILNGWPK